MVKKNILSSHYLEYSSRLNEQLKKRVKIKTEILKKVIKETNYKNNNNQLNIAVFGVSDKRYISQHKAIFEKIFQKDIIISTFDIDLKHLKGEKKIIKHDLTKPLPFTNFDIIFAHSLLKFIETNKQWDVIINSYNALKKNGIAIHICHDSEIKKTADLKKWQFVVPIDKWFNKLKEKNIKVKKISWNISKVKDKHTETTLLLLIKD